MRVSRGVSITENHFGFLRGRFTTKVIHLVRRLVEQYRKRDLHIVFIDLEKAYDSFNGRSMECLEAACGVQPYTRVIKDMYDGAKMKPRQGKARL